MIVGGWSFGTVTGFGFCLRRPRAVALSCANGDHKRIVAGCRDRAEAVASVHAKTTEVAGSDDHNDAVIPGCFDCLAERILGVACWNSPAKREVEDRKSVV